MNNLFSILTLLASDCFILPLFELLFLVVFFYALALEKGWIKSSGPAIIRRGENFNYFQIAYGITTLVLIQIINSAEALKGYKTIISFIDLVLLTYLTFFNSWFRNKIISFIIASQEKVEWHHNPRKTKKSLRKDKTYRK